MQEQQCHPWASRAVLEEEACAYQGHNSKRYGSSPGVKQATVWLNTSVLMVADDRLPAWPADAAPSATTNQAVAIVKQCVQKANSVPAPAVLSAMLDLEAAKLPVS